MTTKKDQVAEIMQQWYAEMESHGISVQPKASTILGTILAKHLTSDEDRDIWAEAMTIKGGEFPAWYANLSKQEKIQYEEARQKASEKYDPRYNKQLLKG
tara:strand:+ start:176 stop:475 length:300 start_codon:yes stop_codon:yes gene_type:complete